MSSPRVVSLLPSATEIACSVGLRDQLVGVSHECDHPGGVDTLPILTSSKIFAEALSREIDRDVRRVLRDALAVYDIDVDLLARVQPDVIVTQDLCDVCAVSLNDVERAVAELARPDITLVNLHPKVLGDIWDDIRKVGAATGRETEAEAACKSMDERRDAVAARSRELARPNVLTIEWLDPIMIGATWMPELVELAGGTPLVTKPGEHAPTLTREALAALDPAPDVVLVKPCGFPLERTHRELDTLRATLADMPWPAVREGNVWLADGNAFFNRPGPRIVDSLEILAACVHPEVFGDLAERHAGSFERLA